jgi:hypothetical protein
MVILLGGVLKPQQFTPEGGLRIDDFEKKNLLYWYDPKSLIFCHKNL